jgi:hypothetical protein
MKRLLWYPAHGLFRGLEALYQRAYKLQPVGPLLYVQEKPYRGPVRRLEGGGSLQPGDPIGIIHFNNTALQRAQRERGGPHGGFVFARLLVSALQSLAERVETDPALQRLPAFHGVTWIPPHGRRVGFEAQPLPDTWRNRLLALYFRMLLFAFNPQAARRERGRPLQAHEWWLSREQLQDKFGHGRRPR